MFILIMLLSKGLYFLLQRIFILLVASYLFLEVVLLFVDYFNDGLELLFFILQLLVL